MTLYQVMRLLVCLVQGATVHAIGNQIRGSTNQVGIKRKCALKRAIGALEDGLPSVRISRVLVISKAQGYPCRSVVLVHAHHPFQHCDGVLVRTGPWNLRPMSR